MPIPSVTAKGLNEAIWRIKSRGVSLPAICEEAELEYAAVYSSLRNGRISHQRHDTLVAALIKLWPVGLRKTQWLHNQISRLEKGMPPSDGGAQEKTRQCLRCRAEFVSPHFGVRMCDRCRTVGSNYEDCECHV